MSYFFKTFFLLSIIVLQVSGETKSEDVVSNAMVELGHRLFYEADLSINGTMSCATCHEQKKAFSDGNVARRGALDDEGKRNVPGLSNIGSFKNLAWANNHLSGLAEQSLMPIKGTDPIEMGMNGYEDEIEKRLSKNECYVKLFKIAFTDENGTINLGNVSIALENFQKTFISMNSLYDNNKQLLTKEAQEGEKLFFGKAKCNTCHTAPLFSDDDFHQVQLSNTKQNSKFIDYGLFDVTGKEKDKNFFRTPSLRNVALSGPYWHDGSAKTLKEAIQKHNIKINHKLTKLEINQIIAFLDTLTDYEFINNKKFSKPSKECEY